MDGRLGLGDPAAGVLAAAGLSDIAATALAVIRGFGELGKATTEHEIADYAQAHRSHLTALLLFELAHEGRVIPQMERAAALGHFGSSLERWADRLPTLQPPAAA